MNVVVIEANICTAMYPDGHVIGSKVIDHGAFWLHLCEAIAGHDPARDRILGQHYLVLPAEAYRTVSCGVGPSTPVSSAYVPRDHRGHVGAYLKRIHAAPVEHLAAVVYTREAYFLDPDVANDFTTAGYDERERIGRAADATHVLVAVLASAGGRSPLPPSTFVRNLAGANHEALAWSADEIRAKARESQAFWEKWSIVAD